MVCFVALGVDTARVATGTTVTLTADATFTFVLGDGVAIVNKSLDVRLNTSLGDGVVKVNSSLVIVIRSLVDAANTQPVVIIVPEA